MNDFLILLNDNQGFLALISILVTLLGFFFINKNIKQVIKGGEKSSTDVAGGDMKKKTKQVLEIGNNSQGQQAGRDIG